MAEPKIKKRGGREHDLRLGGRVLMDKLKTEFRRVENYDGDRRARLYMGGGLYVEIVPGGRQTYLWIGDDKSYLMSTTPPSSVALRRFAQAILRTLDQKEGR